MTPAEIATYLYAHHEAGNLLQGADLTRDEIFEFVGVVLALANPQKG